MPSYLLIALPVLIISLVLIVAVTCVDLAERRVPVQYAKRVVGRKMYGGQSTHIPLKMNASGVLPLIFASAIMQFPSTIFAFVPNSSIAQWWNSHVSTMTWGYQLIFALLIFGFTFFYSSITFNPVEISDVYKRQTMNHARGMNRKVAVSREFPGTSPRIGRRSSCPSKEK